MACAAAPSDELRQHRFDVFADLRARLLHDIPEFFEVLLKGSISRDTAISDRLGYKSDIDCIAFLSGDVVNGRWKLEIDIREKLARKGYNVHISPPGPFICFEFRGIEVDCILYNDYSSQYRSPKSFSNTAMMLLIRRRTRWELENEDALSRYTNFTVSIDEPGDDGSYTHTFSDGMYGSGDESSRKEGGEIAQFGHPLLFNALMPGMDERYSNDYWRHLVRFLKQSKQFLKFRCNAFHIEYNVFDVLKDPEFLHGIDYITFLPFTAAFLNSPLIARDRLLMGDPSFVRFREAILMANQAMIGGQNQDAVGWIIHCFKEVESPDLG